MKNIVRHTVPCAVFALATLALAALAPAAAEDWPTRNVTVVVPLPAGVTSDVVARVVMDQVGRQLGQTFVIENRPGAGGTIGANAVAKAEPDGYTALIYGALAGANALYTKLPFDTLTDFTPVAFFGQQPLVVAAPAGRFKSLADLVAKAKANPGKLNYASAGVGSAAHLGAERLAVSSGIQVQHVPFKGGEMMTELVAGRVDFSVSPITTVINLIRDGKLQALAVSATTRSATLPDVPTMTEAGFKKDAVYPFYTAIYLPAKTPMAIADKLHDEVEKALKAPAVLAKLQQVGFEPRPMSRAQFAAFFKDDVAANMELVKAAKIPRQ